MPKHKLQTIKLLGWPRKYSKLTSATGAAAAAATASVLVSVVLASEASLLAAAPAAAPAVAAAVLQTHGLEPAGQLLVALHQQLDQVLDQVAVLLVEEGCGEAEVAHAAGSADAVDVLLHVPGQVEVDDVLHVGDVQTSGRHRRRHDDRGLPGLEPE